MARRSGGSPPALERTKSRQRPRTEATASSKSLVDGHIRAFDTEGNILELAARWRVGDRLGPINAKSRINGCRHVLGEDCAIGLPAGCDDCRTIGTLIADNLSALDAAAKHRAAHGVL